jgi:hypothetical protein
MDRGEVAHGSARPVLPRKTIQQSRMLAVKFQIVKRTKNLCGREIGGSYWKEGIFHSIMRPSVEL